MPRKCKKRGSAKTVIFEKCTDGFVSVSKGSLSVHTLQCVLTTQQLLLLLHTYARAHVRTHTVFQTVGILLPSSYVNLLELVCYFL